ncbi:MAG: STAS domain-containing protein [Chitinivibrionales bacterium]
MHKSELNWEIYHRVYRLAVKNVDPQRIAATLNVSLKTVQNVIYRIKSAKQNLKNDNPTSLSESKGTGTYLDLYVLPKTRYVVLDLNGWVTREHCARLAEEITTIKESDWKTVAILMADVKDIDQAAIDLILDFHREYENKGRFVAILDPSQDIEPFIAETGLEEKIPVYGTEKTFEDKAFASRNQSITQRRR